MDDGCVRTIVREGSYCTLKVAVVGTPGSSRIIQWHTLDLNAILHTDIAQCSAGCSSVFLCVQVRGC